MLYKFNCLVGFNGLGSFTTCFTRMPKTLSCRVLVSICVDFLDYWEVHFYVGFMNCREIDSRLFKSDIECVFGFISLRILSSITICMCMICFDHSYSCLHYYVFCLLWRIILVLPFRLILLCNMTHEFQAQYCSFPFEFYNDSKLGGWDCVLRWLLLGTQCLAMHITCTSSNFMISPKAFILDVYGLILTPHTLFISFNCCWCRIPFLFGIHNDHKFGSWGSNPRLLSAIVVCWTINLTCTYYNTMISSLAHYLFFVGQGHIWVLITSLISYWNRISISAFKGYCNCNFPTKQHFIDHKELQMRTITTFYNFGCNSFFNLCWLCNYELDWTFFRYKIFILLRNQILESACELSKDFCPSWNRISISAYELLKDFNPYWNRIYKSALFFC